MANTWFEVDKAGLGQLAEGGSKGRLIAELIQNALDEQVTKVDVTLEPIAGKRLIEVRVEDDSPEGFRNLTDAYTLFGPSYKKYDPTKRGRFNLGEKLFLSVCAYATVVTTTGTVEFAESGRRVQTRAKRSVGSVLTGALRMTRDEYQQALAYLRSIIKPADVSVTVNGEDLVDRQPVEVFEAQLETVVADEQGAPRPAQRKTTIELYEPSQRGEATLYEMGLPVLQMGHRWHVNVLQKVPLTLDRENVPARYLKRLGVLVLNRMYERLTIDDANATWVEDATKHSECSNEAITRWMDLKFGENRAAFSPSDPESAMQVVARGGTIIHARSLSPEQRTNARRAGALKSSAELYPSPSPYSDDPNAPREKVVPPEQWTAAMASAADYARRLAIELMGLEIDVKITRAGHNFRGCYGERQLTFNLSVLGDEWFENASAQELHALLLHEFAHEYSGNHLSEEYHRAICSLAAKLIELALTQPNLVRRVTAPRPALPSSLTTQAASEIQDASASTTIGAAVVQALSREGGFVHRS